MSNEVASLTLCANELQARHLRAHWQRRQIQGDQKAWESPQILSLDRWVRETWLASWPTEELISRSKERWLWQQLIAQDADTQNLLAPDALAEPFMHCWKLCHQYQLYPHEVARWTPEQELFSRLFRRFEERLQERHWRTEAELGKVVLGMLNEGSLTVPPSVQAYGFEAIIQVATHSLLLDALGASPAPKSAQAPKTSAWTCESNSELWQAIADQIELTLQQQPDARIVVAVSGLSQQLDNVDIHWTPRLAPEFIRDSSSPRPWQIEHPQGLDSVPAIGAMLDIAALAAADGPSNIDFIGLSAVLRHPLLFNADEAQTLARAEKKLRRCGMRFSAEDLYRLLPEDTQEPLRQRLRLLSDVVSRSPSWSTGDQWVAHWQKRWEALPLHEPAAHWGIREQLQQALASFVSLSEEIGAMSAQRAVSLLRGVLSDHYHSPRQTHDLPIIVCDRNLAHGIPCTHRFLIGASAHDFPRARPQLPWLGPDWLEKAQAPEATASSWLAAERKIAEQLCHPPTQALFCALHDDAGNPQRPSPLFEVDWRPWSSAVPSEPELNLERGAQDRVLPLSEERQDQQTGGSSLLRRQALSPFAAFSYHRLRAKELPEIPNGLDAARQGEWVHAVLRDFWRQYRNSKVLAETDDRALTRSVASLTAACAAEFVPASRFGLAMQKLEADRVSAICLRWLMHERRRVEPFTVLLCEEPLLGQVGKLRLKLQLDRLDRVETEHGPRFLVIDYKTGTTSMSGWRGALLKEPQLPLYATGAAAMRTDVPRIDGICLAHVHEQRPALMAATNWRPRLTEDLAGDKTWKYAWDEERDRWIQQLTDLAEKFGQGEIRHRSATVLERDFALRACAFLVDRFDDRDIEDAE